MKKLLLVLLFVSLSVSCSKGDKNFLDLIKNNGEASGAVHIMRLFESMVDVVSQGIYNNGSGEWSIGDTRYLITKKLLIT